MYSGFFFLLLPCCSHSLSFEPLACLLRVCVCAGNAVPIPGIGWLDRIAAPETLYTVDNVTYSSVYSAMMEGKPLEHPCRNFNAYVNSYFFSPGVAAFVSQRTGLKAAHYLLCYLRNFVGAMIVYYGVGLLFHYHCYIHPRAKRIFAERPMPTSEVIWDQIGLAQKSMFLYVVYTTVDEFLIEEGYTQIYSTIDEIGGWFNYIFFTAIYFACVEIGIYWMHRTLHTNKFLYKHIHLRHHKYKTPETLTPWASIAFHPLDGILQACPYTLVMPFVPCHFLTHFGLLFFTAIWATYIHDAMDWNVDPIMGSKYHTVHHTHYMYNFGQVFTFCDRIWGTFREPEGPTGIKTKKSQ